MSAHGNYFKYLPTIPYDTFDGSNQYKVVTNVFKRVRATLEARTDKTIYYNYAVPDGDKPEHISYKYYGEAKYYWVILLMNEIRDPQWCWPLDSFSLERFISAKYGSSEIASTQILHHVTREIRAPATDDTYTTGDIVIYPGLIVPDTFTYEYWGSIDGTPTAQHFFGPEQSRMAVSALSYEIEQNDRRRNISLLRKDLIQEFIGEFENLVTDKR